MMARLWRFTSELMQGPRMDHQKLQRRLNVLRGIGKSFQSAITAPRINLTGYGNATAQSYRNSALFEFIMNADRGQLWYSIFSIQ